MALVVSVAASALLSALRAVQAVAARLPGPAWAKPAIGGLALGVAAVPVIMLVGPQLGREGMGLGILGGGYGAAQVAITGVSWFPAGWLGVDDRASMDAHLLAWRIGQAPGPDSSPPFTLGAAHVRCRRVGPVRRREGRRVRHRDPGSRGPRIAWCGPRSSGRHDDRRRGARGPAE
jgi:hypothetical protein